MQTRVITVLNIKGGVAKTTSVVNLAAGLARRDRRVLVVDMDPQANASFALLGTTQPDRSLYNVLLSGDAGLTDIIVASSSQVDVAAAHIALSAADLVLAAVPGRERLLARRLRQLAGYDYILIDTPPSLGLMSVNSITAAGEVFIPVSAGTFALLGISVLEATLAQVKENLELDLPVISGVIVTLFDRTRVAMDTVAALEDHFGDRVFRTKIPKYKDFPESQSRSLSIFEYAPDSPAAQAYGDLVEEVIHAES